MEYSYKQSIPLARPSFHQQVNENMSYALSFGMPSTVPRASYVHGGREVRSCRRTSRGCTARRALRDDGDNATMGTHSIKPAASTTPTRREVLHLAAGILATTTLGPAWFVEPARAEPAVDTPEARAALRAALVENIVKTKAPAVLRLVFHDAGTYKAATNDGGMNGSVRFELARPESFGLKRGLG